MKGLMLIMILSSLITSCNSKTAKNNVIQNPDIKETSAKKIKESTASDKALVKATILLQSNINPDTFVSDITTIKKSGLYSPAVCNAFLQDYKLSENYPSYILSLTYRDALEAAKKGIEQGIILDKWDNNPERKL